MSGIEKVLLQQIRPVVTQGTLKKSAHVPEEKSFRSILERAEGVKFSAHAQQRMVERGIVMDDNGLVQLNRAIQKAREKGANNALILMNNSAFITNVRNQTVITAADKESLRENVFTNIDSAIVL